MRHVYLHPSLFVNRGANRPDHSLHRLSRSLDDTVAPQNSNWAILDDHPRSTSHCSHRALCLGQTRQWRLVVRLRDVVHKFQPNFTEPCHQSSTYPFSGHPKCQRFPFFFVSHAHVVQMEFWKMSLFLISLSDGPSDSPPLPPFPRLRNGRCVIWCSILSCSLGCRGRVWRVVFLSPNSSSFLCSSGCSCSTSATSSRILPFLLQFQFWFDSVLEFLLRFRSRRPPEN